MVTDGDYVKSAAKTEEFLQGTGGYRFHRFS
jgi:hypothetical protein